MGKCAIDEIPLSSYIQLEARPPPPSRVTAGSPLVGYREAPTRRETTDLLCMKKLALYEALVARCPRFVRKGKSMAYTSANGYMFSQLNKDGELGIRFSREVQKRYMRQWDTTYFTSYGATMRGYILIPERLWNDLDTLARLLDESYDYVMSLDPK